MVQRLGRHLTGMIDPHQAGCMPALGVIESYAGDLLRRVWPSRTPGSTRHCV